MDFQPYNPVFVNWLRNYRASLGLDLNCRYTSFDEDLPDICPQCKEACELNGDKTCYECKHDPSRGKEVEGKDCEDETCEMCGGSGRIYAPRFGSWNGFFEVPVVCECRFPTLIPYNVRMLAIEEMSGLNEVQ